MKKENLSLALLKILEPYVEYNGKIFKVEKSDADNKILLKDNLNESNFYFLITDIRKQDNGKPVSNITFCPSDEASITGVTINVLLESLSSYLDKWIKLISEYNKVETLFDDPFLKNFQEEFENEFKVSNYSDKKPFPVNQILELDCYLEELENKVQNIKTDDNIKVIESIENNISELRGNLSIKTQMWILKKFCFIYAQLAKLGPSIIKDFLNEGKKQMIQKIISISIENLT